MHEEKDLLLSCLGPRHQTIGREAGLLTYGSDEVREAFPRFCPQWPDVPDFSPNTAAALCRILTGFPINHIQQTDVNLTTLLVYNRRAIMSTKRRQ